MKKKAEYFINKEISHFLLLQGFAMFEKNSGPYAEKNQCYSVFSQFILKTHVHELYIKCRIVLKIIYGLNFIMKKFTLKQQ